MTPCGILNKSMKKRLHEIILLLLFYQLIIPSHVFSQTNTSQNLYYGPPREVLVSFNDFIQELIPWTAIWGTYLVGEHVAKKIVKNYAKKIRAQDLKTLEKLEKLKTIAYGFSFKTAAVSLIIPLALMPYSALASNSYIARKEYEDLSQSYQTYFRYYFMRQKDSAQKFEEVIKATKKILDEANKHNGLIKKDTRVAIDLEKLEFLISPSSFHLVLDGYNVLVPFHYVTGKSTYETSTVLAYDTATLLAKKLLPQFRMNHLNPLYSEAQEHTELVSCVRHYFMGIINPPLYLISADKEIIDEKTPWEIAIDIEKQFNKSLLTSPFTFISKKEIDDNPMMYTLDFRIVNLPHHDYAWLIPCEDESNSGLLIPFDKDLAACESIPLAQIFSRRTLEWLDKENSLYQDRIKNIDHNLSLVEGTAGGILALAIIGIIFGNPAKKALATGSLLLRFIKAVPKKIMLFGSKAVLFIGTIIGVSAIDKEFEISANTRTSLLDNPDEINALNDFVSWYKQQHEIYQSGRQQFVPEYFMDTFIKKLEKVGITLNFIDTALLEK